MSPAAQAQVAMYSQLPRFLVGQIIFTSDRGRLAALAGSLGVSPANIRKNLTSPETRMSYT